MFGKETKSPWPLSSASRMAKSLDGRWQSVQYGTVQYGTVQFHGNERRRI